MKLIKMVMVLAAFAMSLNAEPKKEMMDDKASMVALGGYCPVCYIAAGKAHLGDPAITSKVNGKTYQFVSAEVKATFDADPEKYLPQYDGYCAYCVSHGKTAPSDPTQFSVVDGKIYLNADAAIQKKFEDDTAAVIATADAKWAEMKLMEKKKLMKEVEMMEKERMLKKEEMLKK
ncbi:hypothetical protein OAI07_02420 [Akkermansiaceae bacterium]|nr:hypothetical protein [Akkermansiaceae bacterium]